MKFTTLPDTPLRRLRIMANLSRPQLAKLAGVGAETINKFERQERDIRNARFGTLTALAKALNCTIDDLIPKEEHE